MITIKKGELVIKKFNVRKLSNEQKSTRRRILEISHEADYSHLGSCLSAIDLIDSVYKIKANDEVFVLSNGHAGIALYTILEKYGLLKKDLTKNLKIHPDRNPKLGIHVSTGSLGQGLPIALGLAVSDRNKNVYCMISDGECSEGSVWESLSLSYNLKLNNLKIIVNANGWGAYDPIEVKTLLKKIKSFGAHVIIVEGHNYKSIAKSLKTKVKDKPLVVFAKTTVEQFPFLKEQDAHYYVMKEEDYTLANDLLR